MKMDTEHFGMKILSRSVSNQKGFVVLPSPSSCQLFFASRLANSERSVSVSLQCCSSLLSQFNVENDLDRRGDKSSTFCFLMSALEKLFLEATRTCVCFALQSPCMSTC